MFGYKVMHEETITDLDIQALVDGELSWERTQQVRDYLAANPIARQRYQELLEQNRMLSEWWSRQKGQNH